MWLIFLLAVAAFAQSGENCTFRSDPDEFLQRESRARRDVFTNAGKLKAAGKTVAASAIPRKNFIDELIFAQLEKQGVPSAAISTDAEFVRRIYLDLTGRPPTPQQVREFLANPDEGKRDVLIDRLLYSFEFTDRWASWFGDLLQNNRTAANVNQQTEGRNRLHEFLKNSIADAKSVRDIAFELITGIGNNYDNGPANHVLKSVVSGPVQDRYDQMMVRNNTAFLGMAHWDCLACHNGRGHLDQLSAWGKEMLRTDAYKMSAFYSRIDVRNRTAPTGDYYVNSFDITERTTGNYAVNTNYGNRPNRVRINNVASYDAEYRDGAKPAAGANWRVTAAEKITSDPMFAVNFANRLWKQMFNLGLVEPVDSLDPARLDPKAGAPDGWSLQASNPELLARLAQEFRDNYFNLRETLRVIVSSNAYQLSSRYDGPWSVDKVTLYARHYPRRLEAEELHEALMQASGLVQQYTVGGWPQKVTSAWQLPDTVEPLGNEGNARTFMDSFLRGNRDTLTRTTASSILQQLSIMNDTFVLNRIRTTSSPNLQAVAKITDADKRIEEMFLLYLSRLPSDRERAVAKKAANLDDLAWALVNKTDFLFSY